MESSQVFVKLLAVLELHDKQRAYHLPVIIEHTSGTEDVVLHFLHAFKVTGANLHSLIQLSFAVVGSYYKLFQNRLT